MKIAIAQLNPTVGALEANAAKALEARREAQRLGADLIVFPELYLAGYPPEDLVLKPSFQEASRRCVMDLASKTAEDDGPGMLIGTVWPEEAKVYNAVALIDGGEVSALRFKAELPNYGVFDEKRVFAAGPMPGPINFRGVRLGVPICEDIWIEDVVECLSECGAELIIVPNGSPFDWAKPDLRINIAVARVTESDLPLIYVNQVGGQDELVFDGASFVLNADCHLAVQLPGWEEVVQVTEWEKGPEGWRCRQGERAVLSQDDAAAYEACVLGLRDYVDKNGFPSVVMGLSGGIDSALVAAMAVDALGAERVHCVMLPYRYTSDESLTDAKACAEALGVRYDTVPIAPAVEGFGLALGELFSGLDEGVTEENIQSRARGVILMALSNKFGSMVLTTGNKSEMSVGYATLYGDMNGGFNPIKDLYKTEVYRISEWRNEHVPNGGMGPAGIVIPKNIITKAPTAELRENQTDQDSLPPYDVLDDILSCLVEKEMGVSDIVERGHDIETIKRVERLLYVSEYKRRQAAPGVKISARNFGRDRRYPITNGYRDAHPADDSGVSEGEVGSVPKLVQPRIEGDPG
ncbi:MAG: NAD+ synthase [Alphaproteobacteria bacterium]|nr:NAD+ synthase [Alphaproteobacteria bacterium]